MGKQYIKGFSGLRYWPVSKNDDTSYTTGEMEAIPGAQSATMDRSTEDYSILADDQIWDSGADYDQEEGVYSWGPGKVPPEIAIGFRALKADGTYRMVKYYSCSVTSITAEYATKGQNTEGTPYVIALAAKTRIQDGKLYAMSDGTTAGDSTWLDTIDNLPAAGA